MNNWKLMYWIFMILLITGCSSSGINTILPERIDAENPEYSIPVQAGNNDIARNIIQSGIFHFDFANSQVEIETDRKISGHFEVKNYIPKPVIELKSYDNITGLVNVDVTINNTTTYDAYDLRLIIYTDNNGVKLRNADDWTNLWDIHGGAVINPFIAYAKLVSNRKFAGGASHKERLQIYLPSGVPDVCYAIDASFPGNCEEPYSIKNFTQRDLYDTVTSSARIEVDVFDWQNNVSDVSLYCPAITNQTFFPFVKVGLNKWRLNLENKNAASQGLYSGVIVATSENSETNKLYEMVSIEVNEDPVTDWTILMYITEENLGDRIQGEINEMEVVGSVKGDLNLIVCWNKDATPNDVILKIEKDPNGYNNTIISPVIDDNNEVIPPGGLAFGDEKAVERFLKWGMREYPARKFGFIPYGHGNHPFRSLPDPEQFLVCCGGLQIWELRDAMRAALDENPEIEKFEFISIVSCLLSYVETAYCLKDVVKAGAASEYLMYASAFEFSELLTYLLDNIKTCTADDLCVEIVHNYLNNSPDMATLTSWNSDSFDNVFIPAFNDFADSLTDALSTYRSQISSCRAATGNWGMYCGEGRVKDIGLFAELIAANAALPASVKNYAMDFRSAMETTITAHGHVGNGPACPYKETGWQIWFPTDYDSTANLSRREDYVTIGFSDTKWDEFLTAFDPN